MAIPHQIFFTIAVATTWLLGRYAPSFLLLDSAWKTGLGIECALVFSALAWSTLIYPKLFSPLRKLPQPPGGSFINGQFWRIMAQPDGTPHREWINSVPNDGLIYYTSFMNEPRVFVTSIEGMKEVLSSKSYEFVKPKAFAHGVGRILGIGLMFAEGDEHRRQRKALMPAFSFRHIKNLYPVFWAKTRELVLALDVAIARTKAEEGVQPGVVDMLRWASRSTLDIIGEAAIGKSFDAVHDEHSELHRIYQLMFTPTKTAKTLQLLGLFLPSKILSKIPNARKRDFAEASTYLRGFCRDIVRDKRMKTAEGKDTGVDILSLAIESGGFTDENLVDQMMTFLAAGHETIATALTWAVCILSQHPNVQDRLRAELRNAQLPSIRDENAAVTSEAIDRLPYLNAVVNEVLRFQPPVPFNQREPRHDELIAGHLVPAKTKVILCTAAVNHSKEYWGADAGEFNPDRWMGPGKANSGGAESHYALLTFLHGPRACIGNSFSKAEIACLLAGMVLAFEMKLQDPTRKIETDGAITRKPKGGLPVILAPL